MSSKHSILLGTDGPDGGVESSGGRVLMPSAHVLAATAAGAKGSTTTSHSISTGTSMGIDAGDIILSPSPAVAASSSSGSVGLSAMAAGLFAAGSSDDAALEQLMGAARDSLAGRKPAEHAGAPRSLASYAGLSDESHSAATDSTAAAASSDPRNFQWRADLPQDVRTALDSAASSSSRGLDRGVSQGMEDLSAALAAVLEAAGPKGDEHKQQTAAATAGAVSASATAGGAAGAEASMCLCFDVVSSSAQRLPLSAVIAASDSRSSATGAGGSRFALDSFVALEPIDWSSGRHHAGTVFARLTGVNRGADALDDLALELAQERDDLAARLSKAERTVEEQKQLIERLQRQLREATATGSSVGGSAARPSGVVPPAAVAAPLPTGGRDTPSDSEEEDGGIDEGMADEEDMNAAAAPAAAAAAAVGKGGKATFGTQT